MNDYFLLKQIEELDIPQIERLRDMYHIVNPSERYYSDLCNLAISNKIEKAKRNEFCEMLREIKKESALDSASTVPQGNEA